MYCHKIRCHPSDWKVKFWYGLPQVEVFMLVTTMLWLLTLYVRKAAIESQNCWGWRVPPRIVQYKPLLNAGSTRAGWSVLYSEFLQRWRLHKLSRQLVPLFDHSHSKNPKFFLIFNLDFLYFNLCPFILVFSLHIGSLFSSTEKCSPGNCAYHYCFIRHNFI